jgi:hypothetical protein
MQPRIGNLTCQDEALLVGATRPEREERDFNSQAFGILKREAVAQTAHDLGIVLKPTIESPMSDACRLTLPPKPRLAP